MRREVWACAILMLLTLGVYWQVGNHEFVNYDDPVFVTANPDVMKGITPASVAWAFTSPGQSNWHPMTWISHMLDWQLFGPSPRGHHFSSLFLHLAGVIVLLASLHRLTHSFWPSAFVAALFALHPLHVESVAWIAERKDVLSGVFWFLTLFLYAAYAERPTRGRYAATLLVFTLGLMSKPMVVTLPFILLLLDYWPLGRLALDKKPVDSAPQRSKKKTVARPQPSIGSLLLEKAPFFALSVLLSVVTFVYQQRSGAMAQMEIFPATARIANALVAYLHYVRATIWPSGLAVLYPHEGANFPLWKGMLAGLVILAISALAIAAMRRFPYVAVGWFWYLGTLVPVIGVIQVGTQAYADRYTYIPHIGLFLVVAWGIPDLVRSWPQARSLLPVAAGVVLVALAGCTWNQTKYWKDTFTLFTRALDVTANNYTAHSNLGNALAERNRFDEAALHYTEALRIKPDYVDALNNWGTVLTSQGKLDEAAASFRKVLEQNPRHGEAHSNLGVVLARQGMWEQAISEFQEALRLNPGHVQSHNNLAASLVQLGRTSEAVEHYSEALRLRPEYVNARNNLGSLLLQLGRVDEAAAQFREVLKRSPNHPEALRGLSNATSQKPTPSTTVPAQ